MPGVKNLRRLQLGKETVAGTAVVATTRWRGPGVLKDTREVEEFESQFGILGQTDASAVVALGGQVDLAATPLTFEQFPYLLAMAFGGPTTGAADGIGTDKIYTTNVPTTSLPTLQTYTLEGGDNNEVERLEYVYCTKFSIVGQPKKAITMSASLMGRQVARFGSGFTAAAIPTVEEALFQKSKVYLDAIGGTPGTTQVANAVLGYKIDVSVPTVPKFTADGNLYFSFPQYVEQTISGEITFEHDASVDGNTGAKVDFRAQTPKLLQIKIEGSSAATGGTTYQKKTVLITLPIKWKAVGGLEDMNKNDIVKMQFRSRYNATAGNAGSFVVVNELTALA